MNRNLPPVEIDLGATVPGWTLRAAAPLVTGGTVALAARTAELGDGAATLFLVVSVALTAWAGWRPGHAPALTGAGTTAFLVLLVSGEDTVLPALWFALLAYLGLRLSTWAASTGYRARVELAALARSARTDVVVLGVTGAIGAASGFAGGDSPVGLLVAACALLALVLLLRRTEQDAS